MKKNYVKTVLMAAAAAIMALGASKMEAKALTLEEFATYVIDMPVSEIMAESILMEEYNTYWKDVTLEEICVDTSDEYVTSEAVLVGVIIPDDQVRSSIYAGMDFYISEEAFDYDWYLQKHPELIAQFGTNKKAIYSYYTQVGLNEGWKGRWAPDKLMDLSDFDFARYAADYPDLAAAFGQNPAALYNHYIAIGMKEGRKAYSTDATTNAYLKIYEVSAQITNDSMTDREKIKAVHDWMCLHIAYDYENYLNDTIPWKSYYIEGTMNDGKAVCNGYAETFKAFMDYQGIDCKVISGTANGGSHAWNRVKLEGEYYYIDVTWDDPVPDREGRLRYDYYLTKDPTFGGDHVPDYN